MTMYQVAGVDQNCQYGRQRYDDSVGLWSVGHR